MLKNPPEVHECTHGPKLDPRVKRTRRLLEDAMRSLMEEQPYAAISVGDITERATVNRATFYAHYLDKDDLTDSVLREDFHQALLKRLHVPRAFDAGALQDAGVATFEFIRRLQKQCPKTGGTKGHSLGSTLQDTLQAFFWHWFEIHPEGMRLFPGSSPEAVATVVAWSLYGGAVRWSRLAERPPVGQAVGEIVGLLVRER